MNRATAEAEWRALRGRIKETWSDLTDADLDRFEGQRDQCVGHIQERYGMAREDVERRLEDIDGAEDANAYMGATRG